MMPLSTDHMGMFTVEPVCAVLASYKVELGDVDRLDVLRATTHILLETAIPCGYSPRRLVSWPLAAHGF